ncbi:MAG TPA: aminotransferase class V-fold PLP-dependent enzyme [Planctomycetes bacterium]|nr:aminotransferase class V-fold PLP-dependent enzyme [Planctomycetota bacterium]
MPISFNPGPSALHPSVQRALLALAGSDLLSRSHRAPEFRDMLIALRSRILARLGAPADFQVLFAPSATAAMEILLRNLGPEASLHLVHGAFARRFAQTSRALGLRPEIFEGEERRALPWQKAQPPASCRLIALTHNETATGSAWPSQELASLRARWPDPLLVVDATSSLGGPRLPLAQADLWFASVQKCLGLPAGLALILAGPRALARIPRTQGNIAPWADLRAQAQGLAEGRPIETPNMLALYLLDARMDAYDQDEIDRESASKNALLQEAQPEIGPYYVQDPAWRSRTVHNFLVPDPKTLHQSALDQGFLLGKGYGPLADQAIRIANFPAHRPEELEALLESLGA